MQTCEVFERKRVRGRERAVCVLRRAAYNAKRFRRVKWWKWRTNCILPFSWVSLSFEALCYAHSANEKGSEFNAFYARYNGFVMATPVLMQLRPTMITVCVIFCILFSNCFIISAVDVRVTGHQPEYMQSQNTTFFIGQIFVLHRRLCYYYCYCCLLVAVLLMLLHRHCSV